MAVRWSKHWVCKFADRFIDSGLGFVFWLHRVGARGALEGAIQSDHGVIPAR